MAEVRILLKDMGNDVVDVECSSDKINAMLGSNIIPQELTGAEQLALVMAQAARNHLKQLSAMMTRKKGGRPGGKG